MFTSILTEGSTTFNILQVVICTIVPSRYATASSMYIKLHI